MMGNDVERILSKINNIKDITYRSIGNLCDRIDEDSSTYKGPYCIYGSECSVGTTQNWSFGSIFVEPITSAMKGFTPDIDKMNSLRDSLYTSSDTFNNNYGSPWMELNNMDDAFKKAQSYVCSHKQIVPLSERVSLLALLSRLISYCVDAKHALTTYHDYIQRGFDYKFNNNNPSIVFSSGLDKSSIGNVDQNYYENVNIKKPTIDPF